MGEPRFKNFGCMGWSWDHGAMGDAIETLEKRVHALTLSSSEDSATLTRLIARVSQIENPSLPISKPPEPLADGEYLVRWQENSPRTVGWLSSGGTWHREPFPRSMYWVASDHPPHEIICRIDTLGGGR